MAAAIFGVLALACYIACYKLTTERIVAPENRSEKVSMSKTMKGLVKNKPLMWILAASLIFMINTMLVQAVNIYLFKDYFSNTAALSIAGLLTNSRLYLLRFHLLNRLFQNSVKKKSLL